MILDEIQECPRAITSLKYFCENQGELHVACAGSLPGVAIRRENFSFPVGKVNRLQMYAEDGENGKHMAAVLYAWEQGGSPKNASSKEAQDAYVQLKACVEGADGLCAALLAA